MKIGDIVYLHTTELNSIIAIQQKLINYRFGKIIDITAIKGGKSEEQYLKYKVQSLYDTDKIYETNNYLSPYKISTLPELEKAIKEIEELIQPEQLDNMNYLIKKIKGLNH